ncbi:MAG TPA: hypothetical protein VGK38_15765 [Prolixibacteraceae bacterium]|jgi:hypothetical protein
MKKILMVIKQVVTKVFLLHENMRGKIFEKYMQLMAEYILVVCYWTRAT